MMYGTLIFMAAMMIKGGWLGRIKGWEPFANGLKSGHKWWERTLGWILDGTQLSAWFLTVGLLFISPLWLALAVGAAWLVYARVSMGEEAGGVGSYHEAVGDYVEWLGESKGRSFAWHKGYQYGATFGGALVIGAWLGSGAAFPYLIVAGAMFPIAYYIGNSIHFYLHKQSSVAYSEVIWGALLGAAWDLHNIYG